MPRFRAPLGGVAGQRTQMSNDPRFVAPIAIGAAAHQKQINTMKKQLTTLKTTIDNLRSKSNDSGERYQALVAKLRDKLGMDWIRNLPKLQTLDDAAKVITQLEGQFQKCKDELTKVKDGESQDRQNLKELEDTIHELQQNYADALRKIEEDPDVEGDFDDVLAAIDGLSELPRLNDPQARKNRLQEIINIISDSIARVSARNVNWQGDVNSNVERLEELRAELLATKEREREASGRVEQKQGELRAAQERGERANARAEEKQNEYREEINRLRAEANDDGTTGIPVGIRRRGPGLNAPPDQLLLTDDGAGGGGDGSDGDGSDGDGSRGDGGDGGRRIRPRFPEATLSEATVLPVQKYKSKLNMSALHKLGRLKI